MTGRISSARIEWRLFVAAWLAYAFFHQGGGWNQNAKFATVRAVVEQGTFSIDSYLFYSSAETTEDGFRFVRTPMVEGTFQLRGRDYVVTWPGKDGSAVRGFSGDEATMSVHRMAVTGDLSYANGRFYANQAPGATLLAVPAYFVLHGIERLSGLDPDHWWVFTVNGWLTSALSVGLIAAVGCVLFFRVAMMLFGGRVFEATCAAFAFAAATIFFPYATMLYEHDVTAVMLLASFYSILRSRASSGDRGPRAWVVLAGATAGYAAITEYAAAVAALLLGVYLVARGGRGLGWLWFGLGLAGPCLIFLSFNWACFGSPFTTHFAFQSPQFQDAGAFFDEVGLAQLERLVAVLFSPFRGLFFSSPVLLMGLVGLVAMWRGGKRPEVLLASSILAFFLLFNISLNRWDGGWSVGPRFLIPALPFLALPVTYGFQRYFKTTVGLALFSGLTMGCLTAVSPQVPAGAAWIARNPGRPALLREPLTEFALPILFTGKAWPILNAQIDDSIRKSEEELREDGVPAEEAASRLAEFRENLVQSAERGGNVFALALFIGPVSANPIGMYERWLDQVFRPGEEQLGWNSFNAGELVLPGVWSLLLLAAFWFPLTASALDSARSSSRALAVAHGP